MKYRQKSIRKWRKEEIRKKTIRIKAKRKVDFELQVKMKCQNRKRKHTFDEKISKRMN